MDKYLNQLKDIVLDELKNEPVKIFVFGSRARGDFRLGSDVDIGLISQKKAYSNRVSFLREKIENSNIPYKVDIVNFEEVSEDFRQKALEKIIIWKN